jgi:hypothetical protein
MNETITVCKLCDILIENLKVPYYQRPYRWTAENHVKLLLQDLIRERDKGENNKYRIGTVILHQSQGDALNIVDGQQRLVTLSLLLYVLGDTKHIKLLNENFDHIDSKNNLKYNYNYILKYLSNKSHDEKTSLEFFILNNCEVLKIKLLEISEAFQLFDSQNARGKSIDPADLLKAFHLREMEGVNENEKHDIVNRWEEAIDKKKLNDVLENYLFRLRKWKKNENEYFISKNNVDEFKGVTPRKMIRDGKNYPYLDSLVTNTSGIYFEYDQPIVNGKWFFDYVRHYTYIVDRVHEICNNDEKEKKLFLNYFGFWRVGDKRLIKLYKNLLLVYLDKFGEDPYFEKYRKLLYRWVFITRLENSQIRFETILNKVKSQNNPIFWISKWHTPEIDIMEMKLKSIASVSKDDTRNDFRNEQSIYMKLSALENQL